MDNNSPSNWRKKTEDNSHHYIQKGAANSRPRSLNYRKSSLGWQPSSWEKQFCATAGVPWKKVLETKKYMYMDQDHKVLRWNDSAVEEAFRNAKARFWAQMHGQPCDIKPPNPDIFIDKIDWDSVSVDPQLILDLDKREPETPFDTDTLSKDGGVVVGIPVVPEQYLSTPTGWGDVEEGEAQQPVVPPTGWGDIEEGEAQQPKDFEKHEVNNDRERDLMGWEDSYVYVPRNRNIGYTKQLDNGYNKKWNYGHSNMSRYKISRFDDNGNCGPSFVDEYGAKRGNFVYNRPLIKWRPVTRRW